MNFKFYYDPIILMNDIRDEFKKTRRAKRSVSFFKDLVSQFYIENVETHQILLKGKTAKLSRAEKTTFSDLYRGVPVLDATQEIIYTAANTWAKLGTYGIYL
jgi:type IV secretory pathway VirB4 component